MAVRVYTTVRVMDEPRVELNTHNPDRVFVTIDLDENESGNYMVARTPAECDVMIKAWAEAKRLLTTAPEGGQ